MEVKLINDSKGVVELVKSGHTLKLIASPVLKYPHINSTDNQSNAYQLSYLIRVRLIYDYYPNLWIY